MSVRDYIVIFTVEPDSVSLPRSFSCRAESGDAAESACEHAHPGCRVVWVCEAMDADAAFREYLTHGRLEPRQWVIWHDPGDGSKTQPAQVVRTDGDAVQLRLRGGGCVICRHEEIGPARPVVDLKELHEEFMGLARKLHRLADSTLVESRLEQADRCARLSILDAIYQVKRAVSEIQGHDVDHTFGERPSRSLRVRMTPEAIQDENTIPIDPPDHASTCECGHTRLAA